jgi:hypothetical protein
MKKVRWAAGGKGAKSSDVERREGELATSMTPSASRNCADGRAESPGEELYFSAPYNQNR